MTPSSGIWNPTTKTVEELIEKEESIIPIHLMNDDIPSEFDLDERINLVDITEKIDIVLGSIREREEKVLRMRFGIGYPCRLTLKEVGDLLNVGVERVMCIEANAMRKVRHPIRLQELKDFNFEKGEKCSRCQTLREAYELGSENTERKTG